MALWFPPKTKPIRYGVYRVREPVPADTADPRPGTPDRYARWLGYWSCWATTPEKAEYLEIPGPSAGYTWAEL